MGSLLRFTNYIELWIIYGIQCPLLWDLFTVCRGCSLSGILEFFTYICNNLGWISNLLVDFQDIKFIGLLCQLFSEKIIATIQEIITDLSGSLLVRLLLVTPWVLTMAALQIQTKDGVGVNIKVPSASEPGALWGWRSWPLCHLTLSEMCNWVFPSGRYRSEVWILLVTISVTLGCTPQDRISHQIWSLVEFGSTGQHQPQLIFISVTPTSAGATGPQNSTPAFFFSFCCVGAGSKLRSLSLHSSCPTHWAQLWAFAVLSSLVCGALTFEDTGSGFLLVLCMCLSVCVR